MKESELGRNVIDDYIAEVEELLMHEAAQYERQQELISSGSHYIAAREKFDDDLHIQPVMHEIEKRAKKLGPQLFIDFLPDSELFKRTQDIVYTGVREQEEFNTMFTAGSRLEEYKNLPVTAMGVTYSEHSGKEFVHIVETTGMIIAVDIIRECPLNWDEILNSNVDVASITDGSDELAIVLVPITFDKQGRPHPEYRKDQIVMPFSKIAGIFEAKL